MKIISKVAAVREYIAMNFPDGRSSAPVSLGEEFKPFWTACSDKDKEELGGQAVDAINAQGGMGIGNTHYSEVCLKEDI